MFVCVKERDREYVLSVKECVFVTVCVYMYVCYRKREREYVCVCSCKRV